MPNHNKHRNTPRTLQAWHRYMGLTVALLVLVLSISGVLLNHTERFGFDQRYMQSDLILDWYGIHTPEQIVSFPVGSRHVTLFGRHLYLDTRELPGDHRQLIGAGGYGELIVIAADTEILLITPRGDLVERLGGADGVPSGMRALGTNRSGSLVVNGAHAIYRPSADFLEWFHWEGDPDTIQWIQPAPLPAPLHDALAKHYRGEVLPVERVLLDLHSGRILGRHGTWVMDAAAVLLIVLAFTGTWMWLRQRR